MIKIRKYDYEDYSCLVCIMILWACSNLLRELSFAAESWRMNWKQECEDVEQRVHIYPADSIQYSLFCRWLGAQMIDNLNDVTVQQIGFFCSLPHYHGTGGTLVSIHINDSKYCTVVHWSYNYVSQAMQADMELRNITIRSASSISGGTMEHVKQSLTRKITGLQLVYTTTDVTFPFWDKYDY